MSKNLPQCLHVLTQLSVALQLVIFPAPSSSFCVLTWIFGVWDWMEAGGMRHAGNWALCWKRSELLTCLFTQVANLIMARDNLHTQKTCVLLCAMVAIQIYYLPGKCIPDSWGLW